MHLIIKIAKKRVREKERRENMQKIFIIDIDVKCEI